MFFTKIISFHSIAHHVGTLILTDKEAGGEWLAEIFCRLPSLESIEQKQKTTPRLKKSGN